MAETGVAGIDSPASLLAYMRQLAAEFDGNLHDFLDQMSTNMGYQGPNPPPLPDHLLKANALLVTGMRERLRPTGLNLLTDGERQDLFMWIGLAESKLEEERANGAFVAIHSLVSLCRYHGSKDTFFNRVIQRLEAEETPRMLARRHIEALHAIITAPGMNDVMAGRIAERFAEEGVTFEPGQGRLGLWQWQRPRAIEAALILVELAIPVTVDGRDISGAELLYALGFRARLDDQ